MRTWGGRFSGDTDARAADFTRSIEIDAALAPDDIAGSIAHVRGLGAGGHPDRRRGDDARRRPRDPRRGGGHRPGRVGPVARGHPHERRGGVDRAGRSAGRSPPHRSLAQRPGRDGPAALDAPLDRRPGRRHPRLRARARRPGRARRHRGPARDDPHPAGPAGPVRPPPAGLRRDGRAGPRPTRRRAAPGRHLAARFGGAGRCRLPARSGGDGRRDGLRRHHRELARRRLGPRLRGRDDGRGGARHGPPQPPGRGDHVVVESPVRLRPRRRRVLDRQLDDAQQEEPGPGRAGPWPRCPRHRGADRES